MSKTSYTAIVTKLKAMQAKLLTEKDYETIAGLRNVPEVVAFLRERPAYRDFISQMDESLFHRRSVEKLLILSLYNDYTKLYKFAGMEQKKYLLSYLKWYEVDLINYCFRIVFNHYEKPFDISYRRPFFDRYSKISIDKLITSTNITELVENLRGSEYYEPLRKLEDVHEAKLVDYDLALSIYYYKSVWKNQQKSLKKEEIEIFKRDMGTEVDLMNLQWIYRAKKYYHMSTAELYGFTIPIQYGLTMLEFKSLMEAHTVEEFLHILETTKYADKIKLDEGVNIEKASNKILTRLFTLDRRKHPYTFASIHTYLYLKEQEINKLTVAMECIRYGLQAREILSYVGGES
jgi:V/A-type H+-transporting ATPase subunit C